jgi:hypothetical protein
LGVAKFHSPQANFVEKSTSALQMCFFLVETVWVGIEPPLAWLGVQAALRSRWSLVRCFLEVAGSLHIASYPYPSAPKAKKMPTNKRSIKMFFVKIQTTFPKALS